MKHIKFAFLLALLTPLGLFGESDLEWSTRRRSELKAEGHTPFEIHKILKKERQDRKSGKASDRSSDAPSVAGDAALSDDELEAKWRKRLEDKGLSGSDLDKRLKDELTIQKKIRKVSESRQDREHKKLHEEAAEKAIKKFKILKNYPDSYLEELSENWPEWFYKSDSDRKSFLVDARDKLEDKEIKDRKKKGKSVGKKTLKDLKALWSQKNLGRSNKPWLHFSSTWDSLIGLPARDYDKAKKSAKVDLKRNGFDADAIAIFFDAMDSLFSE